MVPAMRRSRQALPDADCEAILAAGTSGVLALADAEGFPYAGAPELSVQRGQNLVSLCQSRLQAGFESAPIPKPLSASSARTRLSPPNTPPITAALLPGALSGKSPTKPKKVEILRLLARKYSPDETEASMEAEIRQYLKEVCILELDVTQLTGKQNKRLVPSD